MLDYCTCKNAIFAHMQQHCYQVKCIFSCPQADHLRQQTLLHMSRILSTHQAARGLLALGEYFHRLRTLCSLWYARPYDLA